MAIYDYKDAVIGDIVDYIKENIDFADYTTIDELDYSKATRIELIEKF